MLKDGRPGEAIAPLRRAANLGTVPSHVWLLLAEAFLSRNRYLAALGAIVEARAAGTPAAELGAVVERVKGALGKPLEDWQQALGTSAALD
jgi:hypothetical protein